ncbi:ABC transporter G family member 28-like isoform X2 [Phalaenopsis equestris]|uniref:ABC transporter G family member 28-like isoform X2 n=1 Tax=Phalaenopsis equestris TaxID=78828 RepID=UPI0009E455A4|nr:ABC transporter G family member 28-like isoform X2 [Phalaenopsis equestris]
MPAIFHLAAAILLCSIPAIWCLDEGVVPDLRNTSPAALPYFTKVFYDRFANLSEGFAVEISQHLGFCIKDPNKEWNGAFNFSNDLGFVSDCIADTNGDLTQRICTAAEIKFYFNSFFFNGGKNNFLRPNRNCNTSSWVSGCEPGWACGVVEDQNVSLEDSVNIPSRTQNCRPCCEGFFCPRGITCMIPCPLGAYCPRANLNASTGVCDPYNYQPPPGQTNHSCGGADRWADVGSSSEIFCPPGYFCPSTIRKVSCSSGYYCRMGSMSEKRCFRKNSCKPNSVNQNITLFGVLLMVAMSLVLLIIYSFSGQFLTIRERREAKSREAAARIARETVQARERWKAAKALAKKHAHGLSQTFRRKASLKISDQNASDVSLKHSKPSTSMNEELINVAQMMHSIEDYPESSEGFNMHIGETNLKNDTTKGKQMQTRSQIFKYVYGQIEKEKAMQQNTNNLTFSGVVALATDIKIRTRPVIEITFKNLTLTLKGSRKQLLKNITGKLMPGRVAAVMGPSGAGKTTFLSALAGRTTGCDVSGSVLINGKAEPMRSYKKIIGFVPQDDIVHGNLTVEENLWFSARCRLSADMPKADKVLVVERVIESLGLQSVRDCLVGTVEKRGISGGQRKRVNVGLEMVMEPSLLILDEPTSGLDSASSQLLLRALRREALEGVNICMVVHQPSYTLFKMFDDLVLLAKGGLVVYLGAVKKVEDYFYGLGIDVPERVNPPDYFIDILEGIVKPPGIKVRELPLRWMLSNGNDVPPDMQQSLSTLDMLGKDWEAKDSGGSSEQSAAGEVWDSIKDEFQLRREHLEHNLSKAKDLSSRSTPGILQQYRYFLGRVGKQRLREARIQGIDFLILGLAGVCLGTLAKVSDESFGASGYTYTIIAVSLLCKIGALRSFSPEKLHYWRERSSGMSSLAYFMSKDTIDHFNTLVKPIVYLSMFYFFNNPRSSILDNYVILVALVYCVTGIGYIFAICFHPGSAQLWSALLPVVLTLIATQQRNSKVLTNLCYSKWALEGFVIASAERYLSIICKMSKCVTT